MSDDEDLILDQNNLILTQLPLKLSNEIKLVVLKIILDEWGILKTVNQWTDDDKYEFIYESLKERFSSHFSNIKNADCKDLNLEDFQSDCAFLESVIKDTFDEIKESGTYEKLKKINKIYSDTIHDEVWLENDTKEKEEEFTKVENLLVEEREMYLNEISKVMADIGNIKDEIEDFMVEANVKENFVESWEASKIEQSKIRLDRQEEDLKDYIRVKDHEFSREIRVHQEIEYIYHEMEEDFQKEIVMWQKRYKKDMADITERIEKLNGEREKQQEATLNLRKMFQKRQKAIEDFKNYKIAQEEKQKELEKRNKAATKIQAWWRGIMVRKGLGKFRKKKDKKGKKKTTESKKGK